MPSDLKFAGVPFQPWSKLPCHPSQTGSPSRRSRGESDADGLERLASRNRVGVRNNVVSDACSCMLRSCRCFQMAPQDRQGRSEGTMDPTILARLRDLPSVSAVLNTSAAAVLLQRYGQKASTDAIRATI